MKRINGVNLTSKQVRKIERFKANAIPGNGKAPKKLRNTVIPPVDPLGGVFSALYQGSTPMSQPFQLSFSNSYTPLSLNRILLTYTYATHGVIQTAIDQPVEDAFRGGLKLTCDELDPDDLKTLDDYIRTFLLKPIKETMKWRKLFGGAGLILNTDQDPETELDPEQIGQDSPLAFIAADRWELMLNFATQKIECPYNYYGQKIHKSRVIKVNGKEPPSFLRKRLQGWGMSELERMLRPANAYTKNEEVAYELLDEAKIDIWKIKDFNANMLAGAASGVMNQRLQVATMLKNYHNAVVMDQEDDYEQKTLSFSGIPEILNQNRLGMAAAVRIPMTKLFGQSASGFNSGEDDIENYNSLIESEERAVAHELLIQTLPLCCRQLFGFEPEVKFEFKSLRIMSSEQEETIKTQKFNRLSAKYAQGMYTAKEYYDALKTEGLEDIDTEVGKGVREPEPPGASMRIDVPQEPAKENRKKKAFWQARRR